MFALRVDSCDPHGPAFCDKILLYSPRGGTPNHNPRILGLVLSRDGVALGSIAEGETLQVPQGAEIGLRPILADDAREQYDTVDLRGNTVHLKEQPRYSFFTTSGAEFTRDSADEPFDGVAPPDGLTQFDTFGKPTGTLWIVIRDGRGGESWVSFPWQRI